MPPAAAATAPCKEAPRSNREFESHKILPEYNYYFTGSYYKPKAIIGIHRDYTLVSKLWKPVDLTADRLNGWIEQMTNFKGYAFRNLGSNILNAEGQVIGIWYSPEDFTTIRMLGEKQVSIYPPERPADLRRDREVYPA